MFETVGDENLVPLCLDLVVVGTFGSYVVKYLVAVFVLPSDSLVVVSSSVTVTVRPLSSVNVFVFFSTFCVSPFEGVEKGVDDVARLTVVLVVDDVDLGAVGIDVVRVVVLVFSPVRVGLRGPVDVDAVGSVYAGASYVV
jgi:hypothetical protein